MPVETPAVGEASADVAGVAGELVLERGAVE